MPKSLPLRVLLIVAAAVILVVAAFIGRLFLGGGHPVCFIGPKGMTYAQAQELEQRLDQLGYQTELSGQPGGPARTPVVIAEYESWLFYGGIDDLEADARRELSEVAGRRSQPHCLQRGPGD